MEILLHNDYLAEALSREPDAIDLCITKNCKSWVASTTISSLMQKSSQEQRNKVSDLLGDLSVVTPNVGDLAEALRDECFEERLTSILARNCGFDAVVSTNPEKFSSDDVLVITPEELQIKIDEPASPVTGVKLLDIPASYHQILNDVEIEMADTIRNGQFMIGSKVSEL